MRTPSEIKAEIEKVVAQGRRINNLQNEGGEGYDYTAEATLEALSAEYTASVNEYKWSRENTIARRAAWNAEAKKPGATLIGIEKKLGYRGYDLKQAVARHGI